MCRRARCDTCVVHVGENFVKRLREGGKIHISQRMGKGEATVMLRIVVLIPFINLPFDNAILENDEICVIDEEVIDMPPDLRVIAGIDPIVRVHPKLHVVIVGVRSVEGQVRLRQGGGDVRVAAAVPLGKAQNRLPCAVFRDAEEKPRTGHQLGDGFIRRAQAGDKQIPRRFGKRRPNAVIEDFLCGHGA